MTNFFKKLNTFLCLSAFTAGIVLFSGGFCRTLPKGVTVNGIEVGGMTYTAACALVRAQTEKNLKGSTLTVSGSRDYVFSYPEISYKDNLSSLLKSVKRNNSYTASVAYYLCGLDEIATAICLNESKNAVEPYAIFNRSGEPFSYFAGNDGRTALKEPLKKAILSSLGAPFGGDGNFSTVHLTYSARSRTVTLSEVKDRTMPLGQFTTYFDSSNANRSSNIRLAAALINGTVIEGGKSFSFNDIVGARTLSRGFLPAKIIENGEYSEGVGGGVCQVSTTIYNAALFSGMTVTEYHPHSLAVGYVPPSRDAMVSGSSCDLTFVNPSPFPVYIRAEAKGGSLKVCFYGKSDGAVYSLKSVVTGYVPAEEEECSDPSLSREGKDGILSESYLLVSRGGEVKSIKLRSDRYLPVKRLVYTPPPDPVQPLRPQTETAFKISK